MADVDVAATDDLLAEQSEVIDQAGIASQIGDQARWRADRRNCGGQQSRARARGGRGGTGSHPPQLCPQLCDARAHRCGGFDLASGQLQLQVDAEFLPGRHNGGIVEPGCPCVRICKNEFFLYPDRRAEFSSAGWG